MPKKPIDVVTQVIIASFGLFGIIAFAIYCWRFIL